MVVVLTTNAVIYLAALLWVLVVACKIFSCGLVNSELRHVESSFRTLNPGPLHWDHGVFTIGPPWKCGTLVPMFLGALGVPGFCACDRSVSSIWSMLSLGLV